MQIIDFDRKGNVVRFYLGDATKAYYGDDWDDSPYEHNAGTVYDEFIHGYTDIAFAYDDIVLEPCQGEYNSSWCKNDMIARKVPCIIVVPKELRDRLGLESWEIDSFNYASQFDGVKKYYFGDELN